MYIDLPNCSVMLLLVAIYYIFAVIGMEAFRYEVYPQCWYAIAYIYMHTCLQLQYSYLLCINSTFSMCCLVN